MSTWIRFRLRWAIGCLIAFQSSVFHAAETPGLVQKEPKTGRFVKTDKGFMIPYEATIPGTEVTFAMEPIPGGKFSLGSPATETKRSADERPQLEIVVEPFWMGRCEVTWSEYKSYLAMHDVFRKFDALKTRQPTPKTAHLLVSAPSILYDQEYAYGYKNKPKNPAITMSQFAARQYTKWLSGTTGQVYRLPSEAEWEYAARAGTNTTWFFGDDPKPLGEYAWYFGNSNDAPHEVALKKPNPWGLCDIYGNVAEWTLDEYSKTGYKLPALKNAPLAAKDAILWPTRLFPRVLRGGTYDGDPEKCRSASRMASNDADWNDNDPDRPPSPFWLSSSEALGVGFRLVRPLTSSSKTDCVRYWDADVDSVREEVRIRVVNEGKGVLGIADPDLPKAAKGLNK